MYVSVLDTDHVALTTVTTCEPTFNTRTAISADCP